MKPLFSVLILIFAAMVALPDDILTIPDDPADWPAFFASSEYALWLMNHVKPTVTVTPTATATNMPTQTHTATVTPTETHAATVTPTATGTPEIEPTPDAGGPISICLGGQDVSRQDAGSMGLMILALTGIVVMSRKQGGKK